MSMSNCLVPPVSNITLWNRHPVCAHLIVLLEQKQDDEVFTSIVYMLAAWNSGIWYMVHWACPNNMLFCAWGADIQYVCMNHICIQGHSQYMNSNCELRSMLPFDTSLSDANMLNVCTSGTKWHVIGSCPMYHIPEFQAVNMYTIAVKTSPSCFCSSKTRLDACGAWDVH